MKSTIFVLALLASQAVARVPLYFTLALDTFDEEGRITNPSNLRAQLEHAKSQGSEGIISDLWWSTVEKNPQSYDFSGYLDLVELARTVGLKVQFTLSFHGCNVEGSSCKFGLPHWVLSTTEDIFFRSESGKVSKEYISIFADEKPVLHGRTPIQTYTDFIEKFRQVFWKHLGVTVTQVQVGLGPSGQLRYPSYSYSNFCGVGEFMAADKFAKEKIAAHFEKLKKPSLAGLTNLLKNKSTDSSSVASFFTSIALGSDQCAIEAHLKVECGFDGITKDECVNRGCCYQARSSEKWCYKSGQLDNTKINLKLSDTYAGEFGQAFTQFYSEELLAHAERVLKAAREQLGFLRIGAKVSAVHWTAQSVNRAPEMTTGYVVNSNFNFYEKLMPILNSHFVILTISGIEMNNHMQPEACWSRGGDLLSEVKKTAINGNVEIMGENAWERTDDFALQQIAANAEGFKFINFMRLTGSFNGNAYVQSQIKVLAEKLDATSCSDFSYSQFRGHKNHKLTFDCDECNYDPNHRLLHFQKN